MQNSVYDGPTSGACRMTAIATLRERAARLQRQAAGFLALAQNLEDDSGNSILSQEADESLWDIIVRV